MDFTTWSGILADPAVAVASLMEGVIVGLGVGILALALSLLTRR